MATRADLIGIKEAIQNILTSANTTTASPIDLSANLSNSKRVQQVLKVHPGMIRIQASLYPLVTCYISGKPIVSQDIAATHLQAQRRARVSLNVVGSIWNTNIVSIDEDPADEDIGYLMENIELALRGNPTFNDTVKWQMPSECKYYITPMEKTHLRSGILSYDCEVFY